MNSTADTIERAGHKFQGHKGIGSKWSLESMRSSARKAEARIVIEVSEDENDLLASSTQPIQAESDQVSADTLALRSRQHRKGCQGH